MARGRITTTYAVDCCLCERTYERACESLDTFLADIKRQGWQFTAGGWDCGTCVRHGG